MRKKFSIFCTMVFLLMSLVVLTQSTINAAPLAICVSTAGGGDWANAGTWQFCTGSNPPASTADVYIEGPVTMSAAQTTANVTVDTGGSLTTGASMLTITGNLTNNGTMTTPIVTFAGSAAQSVGGTAITFNNLTINNAAGVSLNNSPTVNGTLTLTAGDLNTGSNTLNLASGATVAGTGDVVGNVKRTHSFSTGTNYQFNSQYTLINFTSITTAPTDITINLVKTAPGGLATAVPRTHNISETGSYSASATLQLHYKSSEGGYTAEANLRPWRQVGGRWNLQPGSDTAAGNASFVSATGVTNFSNWAISDSGAPTAVTLSSIKATAPSFDLGAWFGNLFGR